MKGPILTAAEMKAAELAADCSLSELMERAGAAVAEAVWRYGGGQRTLILCGPGNNGGDGYVAARKLKERGIDVTVAALREPRAELAIAARAQWHGPVENLNDAQPAAIVVDALFGTGIARALENETCDAWGRLAQYARFRIAIDLPSGWGCDDGAGEGLDADLTVALGALKPAHCLHPAASACGIVRVADIGVPTEPSTIRILPRPTLAAPLRSDHKYTRGYLAIIGGEMAGAAMLAARGAMPLAGYVAMVGARRPGPDTLVHKHWEEIEADERVGAILIGPGLGRSERAEANLAKAVESGKPLVLDGDALTSVAVKRLARRGVGQILTPHDGEFVKMFGMLPGSRIDRAREAAAMASSVIVLKGTPTVVAAPDGRAGILPGASSWLASAGTGDVLAGLTAARLAAQPGDAFRSACEAVWLHAEAARLAGPALTAGDLPKYLPTAVAACL